MQKLPSLENPGPNTAPNEELKQMQKGVAVAIAADRQAVASVVKVEDQALSNN